MTNLRDQLYAEFRKYPLKPKIQGCPHCDLGKAEASLHGRPLEGLRWKDFGVYPFKAMTTFGDSDDFKHFLPRLFELYLIDHMGAPYDVATLFDKLNYANWTSWPEAEVEAVRAFVRNWLENLEQQASRSKDEPWQLEELRSALVETDCKAGGAA